MRFPGLFLAAALLATPLLAMPESAQGDVAKARAALQRGDGIAAEADLQRAIAAGASRTEVAADMGEALLQQGEGNKAREWLGPGEFAKDTRARGWRLLGMLERWDGNLPAAGKALDQALAIDPKDPLLWVEIGRVRFQGGEQIQAVEAADRALAAGPDNVRALEFKALLTRDSSGYGAALPYFEKALQIAPDDLSLLGGYAVTLGELGRASDMLQVTRSMLARNPGNAQAFYLQAILAARAGDTDLARAMLGRAGDDVSGTPAVVLLQGALELEAGNANVAAQVLEPLANQQPANTSVQALYARALFESGDNRQLIDRYGPVAARADASPYLLALLGRALEEQGDRAGAAALLDRAAAGNPPAVNPIFEGDLPSVLALRWNEAQGNLNLTIEYVRSLLGGGDVPGARRVAARQLEIRHGSSEAFGLAGDVELLAGSPFEAVKLYDGAARVRLTDRLVLRSALALEKAGLADKVPAMVGRYLSINPESRLMAHIAANQAANSGDWARSRILLENLRLRGGNRDTRLLSILALCQLRTGDSSVALETSTRAWQLAPSSGFVAAVHALVLANNGQSEQARQVSAQAKRTGGDPRLLSEALTKLR